jgi:hypothetical protein
MFFGKIPIHREIHCRVQRTCSDCRDASDNGRGSSFPKVVHMKIMKTLKGAIVALSCVGVLSAQIARAGESLTMPIRDVALQAGGVLRGQIVDEQAMPQAQTRVAIVKQNEAVAVAETDQEGRFSVAGLKAGTYELVTAESGAAYRFWSPQAAPPAAQDAVLLVEDSTVTLGQKGKGGSRFGWLTNPWLLAGLVAAAIAIPLALADDDAS